VSQPGSNSVYLKQINTTKTRYNNKRNKETQFSKHQKPTKQPQDYQQPRTHSDHTTNITTKGKEEPTQNPTQEQNKQPEERKEKNKKRSPRNRCLTKTHRNTTPRRQIPRSLLGEPGLIQEVLLIPTPTSPQVILVLEVSVDLPGLILPVVLHSALHYILECKHPLRSRNIPQLLTLVPQHRATSNKPSRLLLHLLTYLLIFFPQRKPHPLSSPTHRLGARRKWLRRSPTPPNTLVKTGRSSHRRRIQVVRDLISINPIQPLQNPGILSCRKPDRHV